MGKAANRCRCAAMNRDAVRISMTLFDPHWVDPDDVSTTDEEGEEEDMSEDETTGGAYTDDGSDSASHMRVQATCRASLYQQALLHHAATQQEHGHDSDNRSESSMHRAVGTSSSVKRPASGMSSAALLAARRAAGALGGGLGVRKYIPAWHTASELAMDEEDSDTAELVDGVVHNNTRRPTPTPTPPLPTHNTAALRTVGASPAPHRSSSATPPPVPTARQGSRSALGSVARLQPSAPVYIQRFSVKRESPLRVCHGSAPGLPPTRPHVITAGVLPVLRQQQAQGVVITQEDDDESGGDCVPSYEDDILPAPSNTCCNTSESDQDRFDISHSEHSHEQHSHEQHSQRSSCGKFLPSRSQVLSTCSTFSFVSVLISSDLR